MIYNQYNRYQQPYNRLVSVAGINGANMYADRMPPSSADVVFDEADDIMYVIRTDGAGFPQVRVFDFTERLQPQQDSSKFATKADLEAMMAKIAEMVKGAGNGEQLVRAEII